MSKEKESGWLSPAERKELERIAIEVLEAPLEADSRLPSGDVDIARLREKVRGIRTQFERDPAYRAQVGKEQLARKAKREASDGGAPTKE